MNGNQVRTRLEKLAWFALLACAVFFGRWWLIGLQPDAALYAGLSYKVYKTGEAWLLAGTPNKFEIYFEHPPYFFQWGAALFRAFGVSEGVARAIGGIPGCLGLLVFVTWVWLRMGWVSAWLTFLMAITFGHYTKYASTAMLEAPLSLAVVLVAISVFELQWRRGLGRYRVFVWLPLVLGLLLATAAKGAAGLGAYGGFAASVFLALLFSEREPFKVLFSSFALGLFFLISLLPFAYWFFQLSRSEDIERFVRYIIDQVLRSATTNRGEEFHALGGDRLYYLKVLFTDGLLWSWAWIAGLVWLIFAPSRFRSGDRDAVHRAWAFNSLAFFAAFVVPFSIVTYQLPHYIHPTYLLMLPNGAFLLQKIIPAKPLAWAADSVPLRWALCALCALFIPLAARGPSKTANRGQEFIAVADRVLALPEACKVTVTAERMDAYRMEAFAMWYFRARDWGFVKKDFPAKIAVPSGTAHWRPTAAADDTLWGGAGCR